MSARASAAPFHVGGLRLQLFGNPQNIVRDIRRLLRNPAQLDPGHFEKRDGVSCGF